MVATRGHGTSRNNVLAELRAAETALSIADLARCLDIHPNTVRFHLDVLVENQQVERVPATSSGPGRPALMFSARRGMDPTGPRNYQLLAAALVESLAAGPDPSLKALEAGRAWGGQLVARSPWPAEPTRGRSITDLVSLLDDLGFDPDPVPDTTAGHVGLRHCPFLELVGARAEVICPIHLGLMQGAMSAIGAPVTVGRLDAFVEPDLCLATLADAPTQGTLPEADPDLSRQRSGA